MIAGIGCQVLVQLVIMSLQYVAGGAILAALLPTIFTPLTGMLTSAVVFIGITLIGGMWSASQSNILNVTLQYIGITVAAFLILSMAGGIDVVAIHAPSITSMDIISGVGPMTIVTWIVVLITVNVSLQAIIQISLGAKDVHTARKGFVIGGLVMLPVGFIAALLGVIASEMYPSIRRRRRCLNSLCHLIRGLQALPWPPFGRQTLAQHVISSYRQPPFTPMTSINGSSNRRCRMQIHDGHAPFRSFLRPADTVLRLDHQRHYFHVDGRLIPHDCICCHHPYDYVCTAVLLAPGRLLYDYGLYHRPRCLDVRTGCPRIASRHLCRMDCLWPHLLWRQSRI